jgi:hypothetical protein
MPSFRVIRLPVPFLRPLLFSALLLHASDQLLLAADCPAGQHQVCLGTCLCLPDSSGDMGQIYDNVSQMASGALEAWLIQARNTAAAAGVQPIPLHIRAQLEAYFDLQVLESVRYRVGNAAELDAANAMLQNPDVEAVTLVDIIVFRSAAAAEDDIALWAHELKHVEQYQQWGVAEFARRYTRDYQSVEEPGYQMQRKVAADLKAAEAAQQ